VYILDQNIFRRNKATSGGAISITGLSELHFEGSSDFIGNMASEAGGAIFIRENTTVNIKAASFILNEASLGGAIHIDSKQLVVINESSFHNNSANARGGSLYLKSRADVSMNRLFCQYNHAPSGGCIFWLSYEETEAVYPCVDCKMQYNSLYDYATNTRNVNLLWWPQNTTSGVWILEPPDEISIEMMEDVYRSISDQQFVWPRLKAVDLYGQIEALDELTECAIYESKAETGSLFFSPRDSIHASRGVIIYEKAAFIGNARNKSYEITMECRLPERELIIFNHQIDMLPCPPGYFSTSG
jgi:hypothetical protein